MPFEIAYGRAGNTELLCNRLIGYKRFLQFYQISLGNSYLLSRDWRNAI